MAAPERNLRFSIDRGGTFTDVFAEVRKRNSYAKYSSPLQYATSATSLAGTAAPKRWGVGTLAGMWTRHAARHVQEHLDTLRSVACRQPLQWDT